MSFQFLVCQLTCDFFLHKSQYVSTFKICVSIDVHLFFVQVFACQKRKTCKNFVKHMHCLYSGGISDSRERGEQTFGNYSHLDSVRAYLATMYSVWDGQDFTPHTIVKCNFFVHSAMKKWKNKIKNVTLNSCIWCHMVIYVIVVAFQWYFLWISLQVSSSQLTFSFMQMSLIGTKYGILCIRNISTMKYCHGWLKFGWKVT